MIPAGPRQRRVLEAERLWSCQYSAPIAIAETRIRVREQLGVKARENGVVALVDDAPHEQRQDDRKRHILDADRIKVTESEVLNRAHRLRSGAYDRSCRIDCQLGDNEHGQDVAQNGDRKVNGLRESLFRMPAGPRKAAPKMAATTAITFIRAMQTTLSISTPIKRIERPE